MVNPKHVTIPDNEEECKGIEDIETIEKTFKAINILPFTEIR